MELEDSGCFYSNGSFAVTCTAAVRHHPTLFDSNQIKHGTRREHFFLIDMKRVIYFFIYFKRFMAGVSGVRELGNASSA